MIDAGEIFHPLRWTPSRGLAIAVQRARPGKRRCGRAHAGLMARQPSGAAAGHGDGWRRERHRASVSTECSISTWP